MKATREELQEFENELNEEDSVRGKRMLRWQRAWWVRVEDGLDVERNKRRRRLMRAPTREVGETRHRCNEEAQETSTK